jgi:hypothetical protein
LKDRFQPGMHPDADQLSTFVEGAANGHERDAMMAHLADCPQCRKVVFLMQAQEETPSPAKENATSWTWRWLTPVGLAGAVLACGLTAVVYVHTHHPAREIAVNNPQMQTPTTPRIEASARIPNEMSQPRAVKHGPAQTHSARTGAGQGERRERSESAAQLPIPARAGGTAREAGVISSLPLAAAPPALQATTSPRIPVETQNAATARGFAAAKATALPALRIEHDRGPVNGTSEVSGMLTDQTGAVVPGATVTLRDQAGQIRNTTSSGDGSFNLAGIAPGHYELEVRAPGFQIFRQIIDLKPRDMALLDTRLTVGAESQTVTVSPEAPPALETESNVVSSLSTEQVSKAATENRNLASLASIPAPGDFAELPSHKPAAMTVALGKRVLSLDIAGTLFVSQNSGRRWKRVKPRWTNKVARIESTSGEAFKMNDGAENAPGVFQLTTVDGAVWLSKDGSNWNVR